MPSYSNERREAVVARGHMRWRSRVATHGSFLDVFFGESPKPRHIDNLTKTCMLTRATKALLTRGRCRYERRAHFTCEVDSGPRPQARSGVVKTFSESLVEPRT